MRRFTIAVIFASFTAAAPSPQFVEDPSGSQSCDLAGYTKTTSAYYFESSGTKNTFTACSALCKADTKCKSFGYGEANCLLFDVPAGDNTNLNPMSPYTFFDVGCPAPGTPPPSSSSSVKPSSTLKSTSSSSTRRTSSSARPSSTPPPKPTSSTLKTTTSNSTPRQTPTPPPRSSSKYTPLPPKSTPSKTSNKPPTKTTGREEEVGPSSTRCPVPLYYQCGGYYDGQPWNGCTKCVNGAYCKWQNEWYYQCVAEGSDD